MAHHIEARFDETDNTFVPPLRTLGFNQNLTMNDSLLVQSYIECYDVSYPEALRRIESEVDELRQHLQTEGRYELNDIGTLTLNDEGNIEFSPCEAGILTPKLYGLGTFEMQPLLRQEESVEETEDSTVQQPFVTKVDDSQKVEEVEDEERTIVIKMSWLRHAVAVAAAIAAFFMIGTPVSNSDLEKQKGTIQQSSFIPIPSSQETLMGEESIETDNTGNRLSVEEASTSEGTSPLVAEKSDSRASEEYGIILASQVSRKNADSFMELLNKNGFSEAYIMEAKFRRVVYGHFASKDDATARLRQLRQQNRKLFGEGWVMKVKNE